MASAVPVPTTTPFQVAASAGAGTRAEAPIFDEATKKFHQALKEIQEIFHVYITEQNPGKTKKDFATIALKMLTTEDPGSTLEARFNYICTNGTNAKDLKKAHDEWSWRGFFNEYWKKLESFIKGYGKRPITKPDLTAVEVLKNTINAAIVRSDFDKRLRKLKDHPLFPKTGEAIKVDYIDEIISLLPGTDHQTMLNDFNGILTGAHPGLSGTPATAIAASSELKELLTEMYDFLLVETKTSADEAIKKLLGITDPMLELSIQTRVAVIKNRETRALDSAAVPAGC